MFEILFLAFAIIALLRLPKDVRRMRERKCSALPPNATAEAMARPEEAMRRALRVDIRASRFAIDCPQKS
jgi:hypothetical protein